MSELISIIVPVYKVEKYIRKCVDSILAQTYKNLEIILVDDGSPDNCGAICDEYAKADSRVKVLHIKNGGVSNARNVGLENAAGQYIGFVDSDDVIAPTMYEKLLKAALENNADIVQCSHCYLFEDGHVGCKKNTPTGILQNIDNAKKAVVISTIRPFVWDKLFKKAVVTEIRFNTKLKVAEDWLFLYECCKKKSTVVVLMEDMEYYYRQRETSVIHTFSLKRYCDDIYVNEILLKDNLDDKYVADKAREKSVRLYIGCICGILANQKHMDKLPEMRKKMLAYGKRVLIKKGVPLKIRICILGIWIMPHVFYGAYSLYVKLKGEKK